MNPSERRSNDAVSRRRTRLVTRYVDYISGVSVLHVTTSGDERRLFIYSARLFHSASPWTGYSKSGLHHALVAAVLGPGGPAHG